MTHHHAWRCTLRLMLTLPEVTTGRRDLFQAFRCVCGAERHCTSWARTTGRHLTWDELQEVARQERLYGKGQARPERARPHPTR